jgi:predicted metal-dependent hydrolase
VEKGGGGGGMGNLVPPIFVTRFSGIYIYGFMEVQNLLVLIITFFVIYASLKMLHDNRTTEVDLVESPYDHVAYLVRNLPDKNEAAQLLSNIKQNLTSLVTYLKDHHTNDPRVVRLIERFNVNQISEASPNSTYTSYSVNKGEKIVFCLRQKGENERLLDLNTMMFVAIHEMAHIMTVSVGHTDEFWNNMKFLLQLSMSKDLNLYHYQPYHQNPQPYCGIMISDTPLRL